MNKLKIVFANISDEFQLQVARVLQKKGYDIRYSIVSKNITSKDLGNIDVLYARDLINFEYLRHVVAQSPYTLSEKVIKDFCELENTFLTMSDRLSYFHISVRDRKSFYYTLLLYWYAFFKDHGINLVLFNSTPHMAIDLVMYHVAKYMGVKVFNLERTCIGSLKFIINDYAKRDKVPSEFKAGKREEELINLMGEDFYKDVFEESYVVSKANQRSREGIVSFRRLWVSMINKIIRKVVNLGVLKIGEKVEDSAFYFNRQYTRFEFFMLQMSKRFRDIRLMKYYKKLTQDVDFECDYVYFPLHIQPERSSMPLGGVFEDNILALQILSKSIPEDWKIYVKENPRQFRRFRFSTRHYRSKKYYDAVNAINKVVLVDVEISSEKFVEKAQFVATLTGTVGWEAMLKNKQCLVFGYPWYYDCNNCYHVTSQEACQEAISRIREKSEKEIKLDFLKYLLYCKERYFSSARNAYEMRTSAVNKDMAANNLVCAIEGKIKELFPENKTAEEGKLLRSVP